MGQTEQLAEIPPQAEASSASDIAAEWLETGEEETTDEQDSPLAVVGDADEDDDDAAEPVEQEPAKVKAAAQAPAELPADDAPAFLEPKAYVEALEAKRVEAFAPHAAAGVKFRDDLAAARTALTSLETKFNEEDFEPSFAEQRSYIDARENVLRAEFDNREFWARIEPTLQSATSEVERGQVDAKIAKVAKDHPKLAPYKSVLKELHAEGILPSHPEDALALCQSRFKRSGKELPPLPSDAEIKGQTDARADAEKRARTITQSRGGTAPRSNAQVIDYAKGLTGSAQVAMDEFSRKLEGYGA